MVEKSFSKTRILRGLKRRLVPVRKTAEVIRPHFDSEYYRREYPDVVTSGQDPVIHYIKYGAAERRNPSREFDTGYYLDVNTDVAMSRHNPFYHYIKYGKAEGRLPAESFNANIKLGSEEGSILSDLLNQKAAKLVEVLPEMDWLELKAGRGIDVTKINRFQERPIRYEIVAASRIVAAELEVDEDFAAEAAQQASGRTLSLDIWDTLLRRRCHPDETKLRAARALWVEAGFQKNLHPVDLFQVRRIAEAMAADASYEYKFSDVSKRWLELVGLDSEEMDAQIAQFEMSIERAATSPDPTMAEVVNRHDGPAIAVSDFYLPGKDLENLLVDNGIRLNGPIYASCDYMATKRVGDLFDLVLAKEGKNAQELVHIGDRRDSDVLVPREKGLTSILYEVPEELERTERMWGAFQKYLSGDLSEHLKNILGLATSGADDAVEGPNPVEALSIPAVGFVLQILQEALQKNVDTVYFFTREGVFLKALYDDMVSADVLDRGSSGYPKAKLLEVSRRATFAASLEAFTIPEMMRLWSQYSKQSLSALAVTLNIPTEEWRSLAHTHGIDVDEEIQYPWKDRRVKRFFADRSVRRISRNFIKSQRSALIEYLDTVGFHPRKPHSRMIVDIGWRGTIQDNIARVCAGTVHGCYLGLDRYLNPQQPSVTKSAFLFDNNTDTERYSISEYAALEYVFNSLGGSVTGYSNGLASREVIEEEEAVISKYVTAFQERIRASAKEVAAYVRDHGLIASDLRQLSRQVVSGHVSNPAQDVAEAFVTLVHNETFGTGTSDEMSCSALGGEAVASAQGADFHGMLRHELEHLRWHQAHLTAGPLHDFLKRRSLAQELNTPIMLSAPGYLPATSRRDHRVSVYAPSPIPGSGGHRTIYNMCRRLAQAGYEVHLNNERAGDTRAMDWQASVIGGSGIKIHNRWGAGIDAAAVIATIDYSAFYVSDHFSESVKKFYFIQDYEAGFNPVGDVYLRSQRSYAQGLNAITMGRWLSHVLRARYGLGAASGGLGVDHQVYMPSPVSGGAGGRSGRQKIAFLYQPEKPRRAVQLCVDALTEVTKLLPDVEVVTYGSDAHPSLPCRSRNLGLITDLREINEIYNECDLGLCISATNPSRIPFEMMAAGCVPVDIYSYNNLFDYGAGTGVLAYQSPASLAEAMFRLLTDDAWRADRATCGINFVRNRTLEWEVDVAVNVVNHVLSGGSLDDLPTPGPSYTDKPILSEHCAKSAAENYVRWQWAAANV